MCLCSIYEKLIQFCGIDELGTNYPKDMFDPHGWPEDSYYEALGKEVVGGCVCLPVVCGCVFLRLCVLASQSYQLNSCSSLPAAKAQKVEMDKLEKAKKDKTKVRTTDVLVALKRPPEVI